MTEDDIQIQIENLKRIELVLAERVASSERATEKDRVALDRVRKSIADLNGETLIEAKRGCSTADVLPVLSDVLRNSPDTNEAKARESSLSKLKAEGKATAGFGKAFPKAWAMVRSANSATSQAAR